MKSFSALIAALFIGSATIASGAELTVIVKGIKKKEGTLMIGIFDSKKSFKKDAIPGSTKDPVTPESVTADGSMTVTVKDLKPGTYAFIVFQDLNGNEEVELGKWGIPTEPMAFSNMPKIMFGPPSFKACSFTITESEPVTQVVTLRSKDD